MPDPTLPGPLHLVAPVELVAAADKPEGREPAAGPKRFRIVAYTGGPMGVGYGRPVVVDLAGLAVPRQDLPVLRGHDPDRIVGHTQSVAVAAKAVTLSGVLSGVGEDAAEVLALAANGFPWQASIGAAPGRVEAVDPGQSVTVNGRSFPGPLYVVRAAVLREVSFVPLGADGATSASVAARHRGALPMTFDQWLAAKGVSDPLTLPEGVRAALQAQFDAERAPGAGGAAAPEADPVAAERRRVARIAAVTDGFPAVRARAIDEGWDPARAEVEALRASRPTVPVMLGTSRDADVGPRHLAASILCRAGLEAAAVSAYGPQVVEQAGRLRRASLVDLCAAAMTIDGRPVPADRNDLIRASVSTGSMPAALSGAGARALEAAYRTAPATWRAWAAVRPAADFRTQKSVRPSFLGDLQPVAPAGELKHGTYGEATFDWRVDTFGKLLRVDRRDIVNDDLGAFTEALPAMARAAARTLADLVYRTLLANAGNHFSAANGNLLSGAGSAFGLAGMGAAVKALRTQKDADGSDLDLIPAAVVVPPELETVARQLLGSLEVNRTGDQTPTGNPFRQAAALEVETRLSNPKFAGSSAAGWYLFAGPADVPLVVGFLDGVETPTLEVFGFDNDPNTLGVTFRVYHDFGAALGDHRAAVKCAGA